uniref:ADAM_spacer1 domain-containing protein n=1 Tax=Dracunculus medinensis TaxID=318479 RepID=A0A0N4U4I6_DRAME
LYQKLVLVKNEIKITEDDINIVNGKGNRVYFIKAPGNYSLHFKKIAVLDDFGYLTGEIGVTLQVPLLEGPAGIRFDLPYTMIPETGLLNQQCDDFSGMVKRDGRQYWSVSSRYCDICELTDKIENGLNENGHLFLPELARGNEERFAPKCGRISANVYEFKRTINLPGRQELEARTRDKVQGLDGEIRQRLNKRRGRFQVFLNLITSNQPPIKQDAWFDGSSRCRCCGRKNNPQCRGVLSFLYCNKEDCKSAWAQQCLHNSARIAACYTVEFNYRMTTSYAHVLQFLKENKYPNQENYNPSVTSAPVEEKLEYDEEEDESSLTDRCVRRIPARKNHLRRYCKIFWNRKLCCKECEGIC